VGALTSGSISFRSATNSRPCTPGARPPASRTSTSRSKHVRVGHRLLDTLRELRVPRHLGDVEQLHLYEHLAERCRSHVEEKVAEHKLELEVEHMLELGLFDDSGE